MTEDEEEQQFIKGLYDTSVTSFFPRPTHHFAPLPNISVCLSCNLKVNYFNNLLSFSLK